MLIWTVGRLKEEAGYSNRPDTCIRHSGNILVSRTQEDPGMVVQTANPTLNIDRQSPVSPSQPAGLHSEYSEFLAIKDYITTK